MQSLHNFNKFEKTCGEELFFSTPVESNSLYKQPNKQKYTKKD